MTTKLKGVMIVGMDMPKNCWHCPFSFNWGLGGNTDYECRLAQGLHGSVNKRPLGCPLKEVK